MSIRTPRYPHVPVYLHTHTFHPSSWPVTLQLHNSLSSGKTGSEDGWQKAQQWLSLWLFLLCFICLWGRPRTQGIKILKYWIKGKECCQTLYLSCMKNCLMDRSLFVCLTASLNVLWIRFLSFGCFPSLLVILFSAEKKCHFHSDSKDWQVKLDEFQMSVMRFSPLQSSTLGPQKTYSVQVAVNADSSSIHNASGCFFNYDHFWPCVLLENKPLVMKVCFIELYVMW